METVSYQTKADSLLCYLSEHGYSVGYVSIFRIECERIISCLTDLSTLGNYFQDYSLRFGLPLRPYRERIIRVILCYFEEGRLPSRQHPLWHGETSYELLSGVNRAVADSYAACIADGRSASTTRKMLSEVSMFLFHLQQSGSELSAVKEETVWSYFYDLDRELLHGTFSSGIIRRFLRWAGGHPGGVAYARMLPMVPAMRQRHRVFDSLTADEDSRLVEYVLSGDCQLSLRDRAVVITARFCGLRACDIAALRMSDVDLSRSCLSVRQRKTGVPLEQFLRPVVGNAICRYVMQERPLSDLPEVFLIDEREIRPLRPGLVGDICDRAYRLAGVRQGACRHGSHLLRHRFAQCLIEGGACDSTAMRLLGHVSPSSLNVYLETDERRLQECELSISGFPVGKEVLV